MKCNRCRTEMKTEYKIDVKGSDGSSISYEPFCESCFEVIRQGIELGFVAH